MKKALIDIGSNSIRLTVYEVENHDFTILFREKIMAGLAGYVKGGAITDDGIDCACSGLLSFKNILQALKIDDVSVFATASLRNIINTDEAVDALKKVTDYSIEIISGDDEALLGYSGAMNELRLKSGAFIDIGGASTEIVSFTKGKVTAYSSVPIGSLNLYHQCVKKILPGEGSINRIESAIENAFSEKENGFSNSSTIVGVGGTSRAVLNLARHYYGLDRECNSITINQIDGLCNFLCAGSKEAGNMILRFEADRIHTIIPGILILQYVSHRLNVRKMIVSKYGVREGYLCRLIRKQNTDIPKTEN